MQAYLHQKINMHSITAGKKAERTLGEPKKKSMLHEEKKLKQKSCICTDHVLAPNHTRTPQN